MIITEVVRPPWTPTGDWIHIMPFCLPGPTSVFPAEWLHVAMLEFDQTATSSCYSSYLLWYMGRTETDTGWSRGTTSLEELTL